MYALVDYTEWRLLATSDSWKYLAIKEIPADHKSGISAADRCLDPATIGKVDTFSLEKLYSNLSGVKWRGEMLLEPLRKACYELILARPPEGVDPVGTPPNKPATKEKPVAQVSNRPKAGTATGRVWDVADDLLPKYCGDGPVESCHFAYLSKMVREDERLREVNPATVQVQFGKWKAAKLSEK